MNQRVQEFVRNSNRVLILSYEAVLRYHDSLVSCIDLLICDEGHRLKNVKIKVFRVLDSFRTAKRILMTGTPLQNNLDELFACVTFVNRALFPSETKFRRVFVGRKLTARTDKARPGAPGRRADEAAGPGPHRATAEEPE